MNGAFRIMPDDALSALLGQESRAVSVYWGWNVVG